MKDGELDKYPYPVLKLAPQLQALHQHVGLRRHRLLQRRQNLHHHHPGIIDLREKAIQSGPCGLLAQGIRA